MGLETTNYFVHSIPCDQCGGEAFRPLFQKVSEKGELFSIVRCKGCGLVQVNPQPSSETVAKYYGASYFEKRTERGYNNYFSEALKVQLCRVYEMNLRDLDFFSFEKSLLKKYEFENGKKKPRSLDVGCAAGYFVEYMESRGWQASGVELSRAAASFGRERLGLDILIADFLETKDLPENSYDFLSFWASIEHMHSPRHVLERCFALLRPGGRLLLSTCRWGVLSSFQGKNWRFMNVPEHLYFFSLYGLLELCRGIGFSPVAHISYGSGMTTKQGAGVLYKVAKAFLDPLVKILDQGDMMALHLEKK